jgi:uncharacterized protein (DUF2336 family)
MASERAMSERQSLIDTLEHAMASKDIAVRAELLRAVTKLFVSSSTKLSDEHVGLFDDVMGCMLKEIDQSARAEFGVQLADIPNAPPRLIDTLSRDDSIDVAGPILSRSEQLDEASLVETAKTKSQEHLLAISQRRSLGEAVTDVLVERGDQRVAISVVGNSGAKFSEFGYSTLVKRAQSDDDLALGVFSRHEIPRQHLLNLFQSASDSVRRKLEGADTRKAELIQDMVAQASDQIQAKSREGSAEFAAARTLVESLHKAGKLSESQLCDFARTGKFDETVVAISLICDMPVGVIERAIVNDSTDQLLVLVKSAGMSWETAKTAILMASKAKSRSKQDLERFYESFAKLRPETAKKAVQFYRFREKSAHPQAN